MVRAHNACRTACVSYGAPHGPERLDGVLSCPFTTNGHGRASRQQEVPSVHEAHLLLGLDNRDYRGCRRSHGGLGVGDVFAAIFDLSAGRMVASFGVRSNHRWGV